MMYLNAKEYLLSVKIQILLECFYCHKDILKKKGECTCY